MSIDGYSKNSGMDIYKVKELVDRLERIFGPGKFCLGNSETGELIENVVVDRTEIEGGRLFFYLDDGRKIESVEFH
jgi:hypothetical protein